MKALVACGIVAVAATAHAEAKLRIGYVDLQRVLAETEEGRKAKSRLEKVFQEKQSEIDRKISDLKKAQEEFQKQRVMLNEEAARKRSTELDSQMRELQTLYLGHQEDLSKREAQAMKEIFGKTEKLIRDIAREEGLTMVLEKTQSSILWAEPSLDLTNELVRRYNVSTKQ